MEPEQPLLTEDEFKNTSEFRLLTEREKKYVLKYLENHDVDAAFAAGYPKSKDSRKQRRLPLSRPSVQNAIARWYNTSARDQMIASVQQDIRRTKSETVRYRLKVLLCQLKGLIV